MRRRTGHQQSSGVDHDDHGYKPQCLPSRRSVLADFAKVMSRQFLHEFPVPRFPPKRQPASFGPTNYESMNIPLWWLSKLSPLSSCATAARCAISSLFLRRGNKKAWTLVITLSRKGNIYMERFHRRLREGGVAQRVPRTSTD